VPWGEEVRHKKTPYIRVRIVPAGKFHRYANWSFKDYFIHIGITIKELIIGNIIGFIGFITGLIVSFFRLLPKKNRPNIIFFKGGYVCLPVGLVAKLFKIPYVIHESDVVAGLANRLLMKNARKVAFGMPIPEDKNQPNYVWTGIPISPEFKNVSPTRQASLKKAFSFNADKPLVVITGGSQGSENLNEATRAILPELLKIASVGLVAGRKHYEDMVDLKKYENWDKATLDSNFRMWEFNTTMDELMGAADVVVSRAGATTITELAALKKPIILVPFACLPGGHQTKNAEKLAETNAAAVINDAEMVQNPEILLKEIQHLIKSPKTRSEMAENLSREARSDAAKRLAEIILAEGSNL
jgi:UDP-N-acetylglucosamine--N-acetylmuramyl-(pentapeptide) pyrophosphoryl-undecaprenol N-acetylglucosamine transferase